MAMGKGLMMYLMQQENENPMEEPRAERVYNLDGTYNVSVDGGGNRSERGTCITSKPLRYPPTTFSAMAFIFSSLKVRKNAATRSSFFVMYSP